MTAWIDLVSIILSEISQSEKDKLHVISLIYIKPKKKKTKTKQKKTKQRNEK